MQIKVKPNSGFKNPAKKRSPDRPMNHPHGDPGTVSNVTNPAVKNDMQSAAAKVPLNNASDQRSFSTIGEIKGQRGRFMSQASQVLPGGRTIDSYKDTGAGAFRQRTFEMDREVDRMRVRGTVTKKSNHPNKRINQYYG